MCGGTEENKIKFMEFSIRANDFVVVVFYIYISTKIVLIASDGTWDAEERK